MHVLIWWNNENEITDDQSTETATDFYGKYRRIFKGITGGFLKARPVDSWRETPADFKKDHANADASGFIKKENPAADYFHRPFNYRP